MRTERKIVQTAVFRGKRHDNKVLKVQILLSRNLAVIAQAPKIRVPGVKKRGDKGGGEEGKRGKRGDTA